jgi:two-component system, LytTR family, sensor kinase
MNKLYGRYKKVLFHLILWSIWLYLSLSNAPDDELYNRLIVITSLLLSTHIPLFVLNTEYLIPNILQKKGISFYIWSLIGAVLVFYIVHEFVFSQVVHYLDWPIIAKKGGKSFKGLIALILVAALSTGYQLLVYFSDQEKVKEEKQKERLKSELSFLRSQISPHFIFNILNSIVYLIRSKSLLAEPVTLKLSELMRYMLYESENDRIVLDKEVNYLSNYIELQRIRFESDVDILFTINGEITDHVIEPMLLIPFVENAFKHGVGMVKNPAIIIELNFLKNGLSFMVKNRIGILLEEDKVSNSGIGLKNVQRRLELLYPESHQLSISADGSWFQIILQVNLK